MLLGLHISRVEGKDIYRERESREKREALVMAVVAFGGAGGLPRKRVTIVEGEIAHMRLRDRV